jgi:hypothetical protein
MVLYLILEEKMVWSAGRGEKISEGVVMGFSVFSVLRFGASGARISLCRSALSPLHLHFLSLCTSVFKTIIIILISGKFDG